MTRREKCSHHVEGYGEVKLSTRIAQRIRDAGGEVRYLAMDEPLWFGHEYSGQGACHTSIPDLAKDVVANIAIYRRFFPNVEVGDIEPFGNAEPKDWENTVSQWLEAFKSAAGEQLAFFHIDVNWHGPWQSQLGALSDVLRVRKVQLGIIYNGDPDDETGVVWTRHAEQRFQLVETNLGIIPDQAVFQTWMAQPRKMLPENVPGTMTWLVNRYLAQPAHLILERQGDRLEGALLDTVGGPLSNMPVAISAELMGDAASPAKHTLSGQVPERAAFATFAIRVNTECHCSGPANVMLGTAQFRDNDTGQAEHRRFTPVYNGAGLTHIQASPAQEISQNTERFVVEPGHAFSIDIPVYADGSSKDSGYVAVIFLDREGREVRRSLVPFRPVVVTQAQITTSTDGHFTFALSPELARTATGFRADFAGNSRYRSARAETHTRK